MRKKLECDISTQHTEHSRNLIVSTRVLEAKLYSQITTQTSYIVKLTYGEAEWTSASSKSAKGHPKWKDIHTFESAESYSLTLTVYEKRLFLKDRKIGSLSIENQFFNKTSTVRWRNLNDGKSVVGQVLVGVLCEDDQRNSLAIQMNELEVESLCVKFEQQQAKKGIERLGGEKKKLRKKMVKMIEALTVWEDGESGRLKRVRREREKVEKEIEEILVDIRKECREGVRRSMTKYEEGKFLIGEIEKIERKISRVRSMTVSLGESVRYTQ